MCAPTSSNTRAISEDAHHAGDSFEMKKAVKKTRLTQLA